MTPELADHSQRLALALQCQARVLSRPQLAEAATALATELATGLDARAVHIALRDGERSRLIASAHSAPDACFDAADPALDAAVDEAIDQACTVCFPARNPDPIDITRAHAALSQAHRAWVLTVPMADGDALVGALLVERDLDAPLGAEAIALVDHVGALAAPVLTRLAADAAPVHRRLARALRGARGPLKASTRAAAVALLVVLAAALWIPLPHSLGAEARIEGEIQRAMVAPADGYIHKAFVRPGDAVREGQVLVELADRELQLERRRLRSELAQHDNAFSAALALAERGQFVVERARADEARARIALIDHQLDRGLIRAPMEAVVLTGDLDQSQGAPVERGEVLLVLAPRARYRLMLEVDARDVRQLAPGASGQVALAALPDTPVDFRVTRIMPVTTEHDGRHYVEAEARLDTPPELIQPGMRGYARIDAGRAPLATQLSARVRQWLRLKTWAWLGL
ncbi:MAG: HlyD family efflux transporter periplasmic adaptor subunit [Rhodocyclaceae bacterium]|nr:HlyD family efflux transporter periplasmic adaptor subunit [Rhodocyclaceae bacterium]